MNKWMVFLVCAVVTGCDSTVPLVTEPTLDIDPALVGLWQCTPDGSPAVNLLILPLNKREYLVSYPAGEKEALFARGCLWRSGERTLVQLDWFGTVKGTVPTDSRTFQFARYRVEGEVLRVQLLNLSDRLQEATSPEELAKAFLGSQSDPELYREEMIFKRVRQETRPAPDEKPDAGEPKSNKA